MERFTTDHLSTTEFEEYCFDLLKAMGLVNVRWRKGTGLNASPSDQGRDIECELVRTEIDGSVYIERWFVECKHYKQGVPPAKISGALAWAMAEGPDVLLLIASNHFSNPTKEYLEKWKASNRPRFRLKLWELPELEVNSGGKPLLLSKYRLAKEFNFLNIVHPAHLEYVKRVQINTLGYLFDCLDKLEEGKREKIMDWIQEGVIRPRYREPVHGDETIAQLQVDTVDYDSFKRKCYEIQRAGLLGDMLLTSLIVNFLLQATFNYGDTTSVDQKQARLKDDIDFMGQLERTDPSMKERVRRLRPRLEQSLRELPDRAKEGYELYVYFCENVVAKLLREKPRL